MRFGLFGRGKREAGGTDAAAEVKRQVRALLALPENAVIAGSSMALDSPCATWKCAPMGRLIP